MVLTDPEDIESDPVSHLDFLEQIPEAQDGIDLGPSDRITGCRDEAIDPDFHALSRAIRVR